MSELNALRRRAVELRLAGTTLAATQSEVGLSVPTIIAAVKAYKAGGWEAIAVGARGRPRIGSDKNNLDDTRNALLQASTLSANPGKQEQVLWSTERAQTWIGAHATKASRSTILSWLHKWSLQPDSRYRRLRAGSVPAGQTRPDDDTLNAWLPAHAKFARRSRRQGTPVFWVSSRRVDERLHQLFAHDLRGHAHWCLTVGVPKASHYLRFFQALSREMLNSHPAGIALVLPGAHLARDRLIADWLAQTGTAVLVVADPRDGQPTNTQPEKSHPDNFNPESIMTISSDSAAAKKPPATPPVHDTRTLTHLQRLEAESIQIMREVVAEADNPVMLYSVGKDSAVMLHLARKAFFPAVPPFPLLHVDTTWKFKAMYEFRDQIVKEYGMELLKHVNPEGLAQKVNPFTHGSALHTDIMKTQGLKQALDEHKFDIAFGGARRDEEKSRAKERVFSFRSAQHRWDAKNQRPELWSLYNARKQRDESIRVFPISNWTELDIWQYIHRENIPIVPLYLAAERPVVMRDGSLIMVDDDRMPMQDGEVPEMRSVRFRTLGCYPLTGAVESTATTLEEIIQEMLLTRTSERQGRMIDHDSAASMEKKKQEGYF